ncbi:MAG: MFS transporter [Negativicutes bacterium]
MKKKIVCLLLIIVALGVVWINRDCLFSVPLLSEYQIDSPGKINKGADGNFYMVDYARRRIVVMAPNFTVLKYIEGGKSEGGFYYARDIAADEAGNIYIVNSMPSEDEQLVRRQNIVVLDARGEYVRSLYEQKFVDGLVADGFFFDIAAENGYIRFLDSSHADIKDVAINIHSGEVGVQPYHTAPFVRKISEITGRHDGQLYILAVNNDLLKLAVGESEPRVMKKAVIGGEVYNLTAPPSGGLYAFSGTRFDIIRLDSAGGFAPVDNPGRRKFCDFFVEGDLAVILADNSIFVEKDGRGHWINMLPVSLLSRIKLVGAWIAVAFLILLFMVFVRKCFVRAGFYQTVNIRIAAVIFVAISLTALYSATLISQTDKQDNINALKQKVALVAHMASKSVAVNDLVEINSVDDYDSPAYKRLNSSCEQMFRDVDDIKDKSIYYVLYKRQKDDIRIILNNDYSAPFFKPVAELDKVIAKQDKFATYQYRDNYGEWIYAITAISDQNGRVVGAIEVGCDTYYIRKIKNDKYWHTLFRMLAFMSVVFLMMFELFIAGISRLSKQHPDDKSNTHIRQLAFIGSMIYGLPVAFLPFMMKQLLVEGNWADSTVVAALPLSVTSLGPLLLTPKLSRCCARYGWRAVYLVGIVLLAAGFFLAGVNSVTLFLIGQFFSGMGATMLVFTLRLAARNENDAESRVRGLADRTAGIVAGGLCGVAIGALLYNGANAQQIFFGGAVAAVLFVFFARTRTLQQPVVRQPETGKRNFLFVVRKLAHREIIWLVAAVYVPFVIINQFMPLAIPLFLKNANISIEHVGSINIFACFPTIIIGTQLTGVLRNRFSFRTILAITAVLYIGSFVIFAAGFSLGFAYLGALIGGIGGMLWMVFVNELFVNRAAKLGVAIEESSGVYAQIGQIAKTVGPAIAGWFMSVNMRLGLLTLSGIVGLFVLAYFLVNRTKAVSGNE